VITAESTLSPRYASASDLSFCRIIAEISGGECCPSETSTRASPLGRRRPCRDDRLLLLHFGLLAAHEALDREDRVLRVGDRLALGHGPNEALTGGCDCDHRRVVRPPSEFSMTVGSPPSSTAMHEFVVPRSMPMVLAIWNAPSITLINLSVSMADFLPEVKSGRGRRCGRLPACGASGAAARYRLHMNLVPSGPVKPRLRGVSHEYAFFVSLAAGVALILAHRTAGHASRRHLRVRGLGAARTSALYHRVTWRPNARRWMRRLDHSMIFVLIAGTYTPLPCWPSREASPRPS